MSVGACRTALERTRVARTRTRVVRTRIRVANEKSWTYYVRGV